MDTCYIFFLKKIIFIALLFRAYWTDCKFKKIENKIVLLIFVNKIIFFIIAFSLGIADIAKIEEVLMEHIWFCLFLLLMYHIMQTVGAGDIKILCVSKLYFLDNELIEWLSILLLLLLIRLVVSLIVDKNKELRIRFASYMFFSVLLFYVKNVFELLRIILKII